MKTTITLFTFGLFTALMMLSCQKPVDDQDVQYLGQWGSDKHSIEIWKNGKGSYQKKQQEAIDCRVVIENNKIKFKAGVTNLNTFRIDSDPYVNSDGFTVMILDNRVFYKH